MIMTILTSIVGGQLHLLQAGGVPVVVYEHGRRIRAPRILHLKDETKKVNIFIEDVQSVH